LDGKLEAPDGDWLAVGPLGVFVAIVEFPPEGETAEWRLAFLPNDQLDE